MTASAIPDKPSSRHLVTDERFARLLEEDFGIETSVILDALEGEPQKAAIAICAWAERTEDPAFALTSWARKHNRGRCRRPARTTTECPARRHGSPGDDRRDARRGSGPARRRGGSCGLDPARILVNLAKMGD